MTTALLTAYNSKMAPIGDLTSPLMKSYAERHGFEFFCSRVIPEGQHYWQKIWWTKSLLGGGIIDRVFWLDADQVITNPEWTPPWFSGFQASYDWGADAVDESCFSACAFVIGKDMLPFIEDVANLYHKFHDKDFPEQAAMRQCYLSGGEYKWRMRTHHRRLFNAVPKEVDPAVTEPWQKGDFAAHLTNLSVEKRVELFHEILSQLSYD